MSNEDRNLLLAIAGAVHFLLSPHITEKDHFNPRFSSTANMRNDDLVAAMKTLREFINQTEPIVR